MLLCALLVWLSLPRQSLGACSSENVRAWARTVGAKARDTPDLKTGVKMVESGAEYWEQRYKNKGTSGGGSYGAVAAWKQGVINAFVALCSLQTVVEFGFGDGNQLLGAKYPRYAGFDVAPTVWASTRQKFANDSSKAFLLYAPAQNIRGLVAADVALSLDVICYLLAQADYEAYLANLFAPQARWVVVYASNREGVAGPHVRYHRFVDDVARLYPQFELVASIANALPDVSHADFFIFRRLRIVASFTTFAARAPSIAPMLRSLLAQTLAVDEIRCYSEVPRGGFGDAVARLLDAPSVTLRRADGRLRSYKKLLPVLEDEWQRDDTLVVLFDDDWIYRPTLVAELAARYRKTGGIVVDRGRQITADVYARWRMGQHDPAYPHRTAILSGSGTLLPVSLFRNDSVLAFQSIHQLAPTTDDLWLTVQAIVQRISVSELSRLKDHPSATMLQMAGPALSAENWAGAVTGNDKAWRLLLAYARATHGVDVMARTRETLPADCETNLED